jgi:hypothetical protein
MSTSKLPPNVLEAVYDRIAEAVDRVGAEQAPLFLSRLCLLLADQLGEYGEIEEHIREAERHVREDRGGK